MNTDYRCVTTVAGIKEYIGGAQIVAFDFETAPDDSYREEDRAALDPAKAHMAAYRVTVATNRVIMRRRCDQAVRTQSKGV